MRTRRPTAPASSAPAAGIDDVAALEEEREFLLVSLRDLDRELEAGDIDEADHSSLHDDYTVRAAAVLRALEAAKAEPDPEASPTATPAAGAAGRPKASTPAVSAGRDKRRTLVVTVAVILVVAVGAGIAVAAFSGGRTPADNVSGAVTSSTAKHTAKAQQLEGQNKAVEALKEYDAAIKADPSNVVALTYRGWLLARAGLPDPAMASLDKAIATNPNYPDAHFFRGMVLYQSGADPAAAVTEFETYLASNPPATAAEAVQGVLEKARQAAAAGPAPPTTAAGAPPTTAAP